MTPMPAQETDLAALRAEAAHLRRVNQELLATVAELRATIERQQAQIDKLARLAFGRKSERAAGPPRFDQAPDSGAATPADSPPLPGPPPASAKPRRRGHGRRPLPADLPRERVEIDLTEAEKACPSC